MAGSTMISRLGWRWHRVCDGARGGDRAPDLPWAIIPGGPPPKWTFAAWPLHSLTIFRGACRDDPKKGGNNPWIDAGPLHAKRWICWPDLGFEAGWWRPGDTRELKNLLGHPWPICGRVSQTSSLANSGPL